MKNAPGEVALPSVAAADTGGVARGTTGAGGGSDGGSGDRDRAEGAAIPMAADGITAGVGGGGTGTGGGMIGESDAARLANSSSGGGGGSGQGLDTRRGMGASELGGLDQTSTTASNGTRAVPGSGDDRIGGGVLDRMTSADLTAAELVAAAELPPDAPDVINYSLDEEQDPDVGQHEANFWSGGWDAGNVCTQRYASVFWNHD